MLTNFNGNGVGFGFGVGCGFGVGWGFGASWNSQALACCIPCVLICSVFKGAPLNIFGLGAGGGCGIGVGLGWGFGSAFGSQYRSSKLTFQGMNFTGTDEDRSNKSSDLLITAKSKATEAGSGMP